MLVGDILWPEAPGSYTVTPAVERSLRLVGAALCARSYSDVPWAVADVMELRKSWTWWEVGTGVWDVRCVFVWTRSHGPGEGLVHVRTGGPPGPTAKADHWPCRVSPWQSVGVRGGGGAPPQVDNRPSLENSQNLPEQLCKLSVGGGASAHILSPFPGNKRKQTEPGTLGVAGVEMRATCKPTAPSGMPAEGRVPGRQPCRVGGHSSSPLWTAEAWPQEGNRAGLRAEPQPGPVLGTMWMGEDDAGTCLDKAPRALGDRRRVHGWPLRVTSRATSWRDLSRSSSGSSLPSVPVPPPSTTVHPGSRPRVGWRSSRVAWEPPTPEPPSLHGPHGRGDSTLAQNTLSQASPVGGSSS